MKSRQNYIRQTRNEKERDDCKKERKGAVWLQERGNRNGRRRNAIFVISLTVIFFFCSSVEGYWLVWHFSGNASSLNLTQASYVRWGNFISLWNFRHSLFFPFHDFFLWVSLFGWVLFVFSRLGIASRMFAYCNTKRQLLSVMRTEWLMFCDYVEIWFD